MQASSYLSLTILAALKPKHFFLPFLVLLILFPGHSLAQLPPNQPEQDCFSAIPVCQDTYVQNDSYSGVGENGDEINGSLSCMRLGERNSVWYTFRIQTAGDLCFTITPNDSTEDYDWAVYNLTNAACSDIYNDASLEVSCSWEAPDLIAGCTGNTGPNGQTAGPCGMQNQPCLRVEVGDTYVINVSNFTGFDDGYVLDFSASTAVLFDDTPPDMVGASPHCEGVTVTFSENIACNSVDPTDFQLTGSGGPYTITSVQNQNCDTGGNGARSFNLIVDPPVATTADYQIELVGVVSDFCGNSANLSAQSVRLTPKPNASFNEPEPQCLEGNYFSFEYRGTPGAGIISYIWDFGDSTGIANQRPNHKYLSPGVKDVTLEVVDRNGCRDTIVQNLEVYPAPNTVFLTDSSMCLSDSLSVENQSTEVGGFAITSYLWSFGDGAFSTDPNPAHVYLQAGVYDISLVATSSQGCTGTEVERTIVFPKPDVDFETEENVCDGFPATLTNLSTIQSDIANDFIASWTWHFGDSTSQVGDTLPSHLYPQGGDYIVNLVATSDKGCADSLQLTQRIYEASEPLMENDTTCFGEIGLLRVTPTEAGEIYWFTDSVENTSFFQGPNYLTDTVVADQNFFIEFVSQEGCVTDRLPISAVLAPNAFGSINASDTVMELPSAIVNFQLSGDHRGAIFDWDFKDGERSEANSPAHEFRIPGIFPVQLFLEDRFGCDYIFDKIIEIKKITHLHTPSAFSPNGDGFNDTYFVSLYKMQQFNIRIFNRHGKLVFNTSDPDFRWNGKDPYGNDAPEGVYVYQVDALDLDGIHVEKRGTVTLIR